MLPPPPPPPPPPAISDEAASTQPTFLEQWLAKEKGRTASSQQSATQSKREYFQKQCLFPQHIPGAAHCNAEPVVALLTHHGLDGDGEEAPMDPSNNTDADGDVTPKYRSALDDMRKIASNCATYKSRAMINRDEFRYKRAMMVKEKKQQKEQSTDVAEETNSSSVSSTDAPSPPPYHEEYTPLSLGENFLLTKIHSANYNLCLAGGVCPDRMRRLMACWKREDPKVVKLMEQEGMEEYICMEEREAVERCVGLGVQRVMKDILG